MFVQRGQVEVGNKEKHIVSFRLSKWIGRFTVYIDGVESPSIRSLSLISGPFVLEVGEQEKHEVRFQLLLPALFMLFKHTPAQVYVDNALIKTF